MMNPSKTISMPPRIGALLSQVTETADLEAALVRVLTDYLDLKIRFLKERTQKFEVKWEMTFEEFAKRIETNTLPDDPYAYDVESDFWEWEQAETLLTHYEDLRTKWM